MKRINADTVTIVPQVEYSYFIVLPLTRHHTVAFDPLSQEAAVSEQTCCTCALAFTAPLQSFVKSSLVEACYS